MLNIKFASTNQNCLQKIRKQKLLKVVQEVAEESMIKAATEIVEKQQNLSSDIVKCGISVDGTWQRRGHTSMNGCVAAISVDTLRKQPSDSTKISVQKRDRLQPIASDSAQVLLNIVNPILMRVCREVYFPRALPERVSLQQRSSSILSLSVPCFVCFSRLSSGLHEKKRMKYRRTAYGQAGRCGIGCGVVTN
ncbi:hypothetical protein TNCV_352451 [Trichonephila clavipes]|nr:hypothetical protein TNCV_352451 [Trichonephila clavipes]